MREGNNAFISPVHGIGTCVVHAKVGAAGLAMASRPYVFYFAGRAYAAGVGFTSSSMRASL